MNADKLHTDFDFDRMAAKLHDNDIDNSKIETELEQNNKVEFEQCEKTWNILEEMKKIDEFNTDNAWSDLYNRLDKENLITKGETKVFKIRHAIMVAASVVLLLSLGFVLNNNFLKHTHTIENFAEQVKTIDLPDGSVVYLNKNASITYPKKFNNTGRLVTLKGEGFFEIKRDVSKPFVVNVNGAEVKVLGTSFNVKESNSIGLEVTVKTGKVQFCDCAESGENIILTKGEKGILNTNGLNKIGNDNINFLSWKNKKLVFKTTPLPIVIRDINASYHSDIKIQSSEINAMSITTTFDSLSLNELLESIALTLNISVVHEENIYTLVMP